MNPDDFRRMADDEDRCKSIAAGSTADYTCQRIQSLQAKVYAGVLYDMASLVKTEPDKLREIARWLYSWASDIEREGA